MFPYWSLSVFMSFMGFYAFLCFLMGPNGPCSSLYAFLDSNESLTGRYRS